MELLVQAALQTRTGQDNGLCCSGGNCAEQRSAAGSVTVTLQQVSCATLRVCSVFPALAVTGKFAGSMLLFCAGTVSLGKSKGDF